MMARPQKQTADYFPHDAVPGKTLFILQNRFGNNGYAAWFKLLSLLCRTPGHAYDCNKPADWQFLVAEMALSVGETRTIIDCLAELDAIDPDLWKAKVLWSQNLVNRLATVYKERKAPLPVKPTINPVLPPTNPQVCALPVGETPQSKLKETKVKEIPPSIPPKGGSPKSVKKPADAPLVLPDWIDKEVWEAFLEVRKVKKAANTAYALHLIIAALASLKEQGDDPTEVLNQSIANSWKGVFHLKEKADGKKAKDSRCDFVSPYPPYSAPEKE